MGTRRCRPPGGGRTQHSPVQPSTAPYSPVQPSTAPYSPAQPRTAQYSPVQPRIAPYSPIQPRTAQYSPHTQAPASIPKPAFIWVCSRLRGGVGGGWVLG
ncbi:vegetative cell wall protein gp1-like [Cygnus olor]|uniref:vegetative cell wall protein gp1-like n=1 Tax=Cygnus olor TaxID=8869 RepID=UPI001ADE9FE3|nr:vegetative cell wall protein gp1-like [Cygnus olor]